MHRFDRRLARSPRMSVLVVLKTFAPLATAATLGCAPDAGPIETVFDPCAPLHVDVERDARAEERASVRAGLAMWNEATASALALAPDADAETARVPLHFDPAGSAFHGYYDDENGIVYINERIQDDRARTITVAHELGHVFGLLHVDSDERPSLMNEGNTTVTLQPGDVDTLAALWGTCER